MTSEQSLFWRAFVLPTFGPNVQAEATILQVLKRPKIKENTMTFLKLLGSCRKRKYFFNRNISFIYVVEFAN